MPRIVVKRLRSPWHDRLRNYTVVVDGRAVAHVGDGGEVAVAVTPGRHTVHMAIDWARSRPLDVEAAGEQTIHLECGPNVKPFLALVYAVVLFRRWIWLRPSDGIAC